MENKEIKLLIGKFLDGETTLGEEQSLYAYFHSEHILPEYLHYREMFLDFALYGRRNAAGEGKVVFFQAQK